MVFNRYWEIPPSRFRGEIARAVFPLILVIGMALFFVRRLQSRPQWRVAVAAGIAMLLAFSAFRGWLEYLVTDSVMPRFVVYFWEGSTRELSGSASQTAELFLHLSFAIVLFSVLYGVGALIQYYGHRGDPARFDTLIRSVDGAAAITGLSAMRGFLAGSLVAAGLTSVLAVLEQLRWAVADASWISRALGYRWPWIHITDVNDDAFLIGWRIFALAVLDAFAILVLVGLPAAISSRISKRFTIRIGIIVVFWTAIGFSLSGMTVFGSAFVGYGCVLLQAACVALVYWRYDLLTAIFSAFVADALVLGCGAFFTFRTLDPVVHLTAIVLMTAVVLVPTLAYFRPQLLMAMRKTARVFE